MGKIDIYTTIMSRCVPGVNEPGPGGYVEAGRKRGGTAAHPNDLRANT